MVGSLLFMMPMAVLIWLYGWFFMWRHLIVPKPVGLGHARPAAAEIPRLRWNVETIGFSPNGFNGYFLFKVLLVALPAMMFLQAVAFFYRSYLEWKEGPESENKYLDKDSLGEGEKPSKARIKGAGTMLFGLDGVEIGLIIVFLCLFGAILSGFPVAFAIGGARGASPSGSSRRWTVPGC